MCGFIGVPTSVAVEVSDVDDGRGVNRDSINEAASRVNDILEFGG